MASYSLDTEEEAFFKAVLADDVSTVCSMLDRNSGLAVATDFYNGGPLCLVSSMAMAQLLLERGARNDLADDAPTASDAMYEMGEYPHVYIANRGHYDVAKFVRSFRRRSH